MKYILFAFHFVFITTIVNGQFKDFGLQLQSSVQSTKSTEDSTDEIFTTLPTAINGTINTPSTTLFGKKENRYLTLLGGYVSVEGESGIHLEFARIYQPRSFGFGAYTSYIRIPKVNYSNWTITGLQLRAGAANGQIKPYGVFDFGLFNLTYTNADVTFRTGTVDIGGGIEKPIGEKSSFLFDIRWKRFFDYKAEREAFTMWTINAGIKF